MFLQPEVIEQLYGKFEVVIVHEDPKIYKLFTDDERDPVIYFGENTFSVFRVEMYGGYTGEEAIIELFKDVSVKVE